MVMGRVIMVLDTLKIGISAEDDCGWMLYGYSDVMCVVMNILINIGNIALRWCIIRLFPRERSDVDSSGDESSR
jgi:hypothetical protein